MKTTSCTESKLYAFDNAPRCGSKTKRYNGRPCPSPAVRGKKRCRIHGGGKGSGAQRGNTNALKHGMTSLDIKQFRKRVRSLIRESKNLVEIII